MKKLEAGQVWRCSVKCHCGRRIGIERRQIRNIGREYLDWDLDIGGGVWGMKISMRIKSFRHWITRTGASLQETKP